MEYPAGYDHVISVGAVDESSRVAEFSTHNAAVDVAAPGVDILSLGTSSNGDYSSASGTSMATPHVAGVAALVWSQFPDKNVTEIEKALTLSAQDLGSCGKDPLSGHGLVDAVAAAMYLEGGGAASENGDCISIDVSLTTDDYGSETMYLVSAEDDSSDIVYRGGPYPDGQRSTYQDAFTLPDGCYNLMWVDKFGDGSNNPNNGIGEIALDYGGTRQVASADFSGALETFRFGSCGASVTSPAPVTSPIAEPVTSPVESPVAAPVAAPVALPPVTAPTGAPQVDASTPQPSQVDASTPPPSVVTSDCGAGESLLQLNLTTDQWARSENALYLFDVSAPDDEYIWRMPRFQLQGNSVYAGSACLPLALECSKFYFIDEYGDGFENGGFTLSLDGVVVLQIVPGDQGDIFEDGSPATFWYQEFGNCPDISDFN